MRIFKLPYGFLFLALCALTIFSHPAYAKIKVLTPYHKADRNQDGIITLKEWQSESNISFNKRDLNHDGILSGNETKNDAIQPARFSDPFRALDQNQDGIIVLSEWNNSLSTFQEMDINDNGQISAQEFHVNADKDQFAELDHDSNGKISRTEWHNSTSSFTEIDRNQDLNITRDEFYNRNQHPTSVFRELDTNKDQKISRGEWRNETGDFNRIDTNRDNFLSEAEFKNRENNTLVDQIFKTIFKAQ